MLNFNKIIKVFFKYSKLFYLKWVFRASLHYTLNSQTIKRIGQIIYTQLLCFFASQETNSKYCKHFLQKDIQLSITEERKIRGNLEVPQKDSKINKRAPLKGESHSHHRMIITKIR